MISNIATRFPPRSGLGGQPRPTAVPAVPASLLLSLAPLLVCSLRGVLAMVFRVTSKTQPPGRESQPATSESARKAPQSQAQSPQPLSKPAAANPTKSSSCPCTQQQTPTHHRASPTLQDGAEQERRHSHPGWRSTKPAAVASMLGQHRPIEERAKRISALPIPLRHAPNPAQSSSGRAEECALTPCP